MPKKSAKDLLVELEEQFVTIQKKITQTKERYLEGHQKEYDATRSAYRRKRKKFQEASKKVREKAEAARKSGSTRAKNELKKAKAAASLLKDAILEAAEIMKTAQDKLNTAKPFQKKLAARAKALADFEREWSKKQRIAEKAKVEIHLKEVIQGHWWENSDSMHGWQECWNKGIVEDPWAWRSEISWGIPDS